MVTQLQTEKPVPAKIPKLGIYLPLELKQALQAMADQERRSASQMAVMLLEEAIAARSKAEQTTSK
jgi:predicted transcriptional regulator